MRKTPATNTLFYGDNLAILRDYIEDESVDLVYLDPPFNSNATYNVLFKAPTGEQSQSVFVYAKNERADLSPQQKRVLTRLVADIKTQAQKRMLR